MNECKNPFYEIVTNICKIWNTTENTYLKYCNLTIKCGGKIFWGCHINNNRETSLYLLKEVLMIDIDVSKIWKKKISKIEKKKLKCTESSLLYFKEKINCLKKANIYQQINLCNTWKHLKNFIKKAEPTNTIIMKFINTKKYFLYDRSIGLTLFLHLNDFILMSVDLYFSN